MKGTLRGLLVPSAGTARLVELPNDLDYRTIRDTIGAPYIEHVRTRYPGIALIVDEEGLLVGRGYNVRIAHRFYPGPIVGDVLIFGEETTDEGYRDIASLTDDNLTLLHQLIAFDEEATQ